MYIIAFNGPPRSGKDTVARAVDEYLWATGFIPSSFTYSLAEPVRLAVYHLLGREYSEGDYEMNKDAKLFPWSDLTIRQMMILYSEKCVKPTMGNDIWARLVTDRIERNLKAYDKKKIPTLHLITDLGFSHEVDHLVKYAGKNNVAVIRMHREGRTFKGDSRSYVGHSQQIDVTNSGTPAETAEDIIKACQAAFNWKF